MVGATIPATLHFADVPSLDRKEPPDLTGKPVEGLNLASAKREGGEAGCEDTK